MPRWALILTALQAQPDPCSHTPTSHPNQAEANGGFFSTVFKKEGFLGGMPPAAPPAAPAAPAKGAPAKGAAAQGGGAVACSKAEERCVDSRAASGLLATPYAHSALAAARPTTIRSRGPPTCAGRAAWA